MSHDHDHDQCNHALNDRLQRAAMEGCAESRLLMSRRAMMGVTAGLFSWAYMPRWAEAATDDPRLLVVVLRGGMDGINVCIPYGDNNNYFSMRGALAIPKASTITLNSFFGLHPALRRFGTMYKAKEAAVVHACATPLRNRSHFDARTIWRTDCPASASPMRPAGSTACSPRCRPAIRSSSPAPSRSATRRSSCAAPPRCWAGRRPGSRRSKARCSTSVRQLYRGRDPQMCGRARARPDRRPARQPGRRG